MPGGGPAGGGKGWLLPGGLDGWGRGSAAGSEGACAGCGAGPRGRGGGFGLGRAARALEGAPPAEVLYLCGLPAGGIPTQQNPLHITELLAVIKLLSRDRKYMCMLSSLELLPGERVMDARLPVSYSMFVASKLI